MSAPSQRVVLLDNRLEEIARLAGEVAAFGEAGHLPREIIGRANLVLEEMVTNIMFHGYGQDGEGVIEVRIERDDCGLLLEIFDRAGPFNPLEHPEPDVHLPLEQRTPGGLGIFIARRTADSIEYVREGGANRLTMRLRCGRRSRRCRE